MDNKTSLETLSDIAALLAMLEGLSAPGKEEQLNAVLPGMRVTLKNARFSILQIYKQLNHERIQSAKHKVNEMKKERLAKASPNGAPETRARIPSLSTQQTTKPAGLQSAIEKMIE